MNAALISLGHRSTASCTKVRCSVVIPQDAHTCFLTEPIPLRLICYLEKPTSHGHSTLKWWCATTVLRTPLSSFCSRCRNHFCLPSLLSSLHQLMHWLGLEGLLAFACVSKFMSLCGDPLCCCDNIIKRTMLLLSRDKEGTVRQRDPRTQHCHNKQTKAYCSHL